MHLVDQPLDELVRVVVLVVVELCVARSYPSYEPLVSDDTSRAFSLAHGFEQVCQLVDEVIFFFIEWFPREHMVPKGLTVVQRLHGTVDVAYVRVLKVVRDLMGHLRSRNLDGVHSQGICTDIALWRHLI